MAQTTTNAPVFNGDRLREAREGADLKREAIALEVDVTAQTVGAWERGSGEPYATQLSKIAAMTKRRIDFFFSEAA